MFQHQGIWLPDGEKHFPEWMTKNGELVDGKGTYQIRKWRACIPHVRQWRVAVDVGAHVGLWSMHLAARFEGLHAFEPVAAYRECWNLNVSGRGNSQQVLYGCALGDARGKVWMKADPADTGGTHVENRPDEGDVEMYPLDHFELEDVDFLKIDCEGFEHHVVAGARQTLLKWRPCVIVEQKPHKLGPNFGIKGTPAVDLLRELGARVRRELGGDYITSWD